MRTEFFGLVKLPATTHVPFCRKCGALIAPLIDGQDGRVLHRHHHGVVDSAATSSLPGGDPRG